MACYGDHFLLPLAILEIMSELLMFLVVDDDGGIYFAPVDVFDPEFEPNRVLFELPWKGLCKDILIHSQHL